MFASTLFADENDVRDFDLQIQKLLRDGRADEAAAIIEAALGELGDAGHPVVALCRSCPVEGIAIAGWEALAPRIAGLEAAGAPVTALGIDVSWPGHSGTEPDGEGYLEPILETNFYTDGAFAFSPKNRAALLEGYGPHGAEWQGRMAEIDTLLSLRGLGEVYGAVFPLVEHVCATPEPEALEADAMRLGAAFVAVRVHQAVSRAIVRDGLPRAMAVIVGSNESYPFYDAPVVSADESSDFVRFSLEAVSAEPLAAAEPVEVVEPLDDLPVPAEIAAIDEPLVDPIAESADRIVQLSGAALRMRLGQQGAAVEAPRFAAGGMFRRLFARKAAAG
jgi:hypothetical protein